MKKLNIIAVIIMVFIITIPNLNTSTAYGDTASALTNADPVIALTNYEIVDGKLEIGEEFTIKVTIKNCNKYADAYNVVVDVASQDLALRLSDDSVNQVYFETIGAGKEVSFEQTFALGDAYPYDNAMLTYTFYYSNAATEEFDNRTIITPKVVIPCKLTLNILSVASSATLGSRSLVNVRCTNSGTIDIEDITMNIEGAVNDKYKSIELGSLKANEQLMQDCYITFNSVGKQDIKISFTYHDKEGNEYTLDKSEYTVNVTSNTTKPRTSSLNGKMKKIWTLLEAGIIIIIILAIIIKIWLNKRKQNLY